jgi:dethiobiotin synthetase
MIRLGVTGTDTGVGKTLVSSALVYLFRRHGLRVAAMKPVETGDGDDGTRLWHVAGASDAVEDVAPIRFPDALAPVLAARRAGRAVDLAALDAAFARLTRDRDAVIVEGAGGLLVPFTDTLGFDGLCRRWSLDLVIVAANRLGVINHTRLTVRAAESAGLRVRAVVLSTLTTDPPDVAQETNLAALREFAGAPVFALPFQRSTAAAASACNALADALLATDAPRSATRAAAARSLPSPDPR